MNGQSCILNVFFSMHNYSVYDGVWHALRVTWSNSDGKIIVYRDNILTETASGKHTIEKTLLHEVLGQDQDTVGGGFTNRDAFKREMAEMNVWGRVLTREEISRFSMGCGCHRMTGDVKSWSQLTTRRRGKV